MPSRIPIVQQASHLLAAYVPALTPREPRPRRRTTPVDVMAEEALTSSNRARLMEIASRDRRVKVMRSLSANPRTPQDARVIVIRNLIASKNRRCAYKDLHFVDSEHLIVLLRDQLIRDAEAQAAEDQVASHYMELLVVKGSRRWLTAALSDVTISSRFLVWITEYSTPAALAIRDEFLQSLPLSKRIAVLSQLLMSTSRMDDSLASLAIEHYERLVSPDFSPWWSFMPSSVALRLVRSDLPVLRQAATAALRGPARTAFLRTASPHELGDFLELWDLEATHASMSLILTRLAELLDAGVDVACMESYIWEFEAALCGRPDLSVTERVTLCRTVGQLCMEEFAAGTCAAPLTPSVLQGLLDHQNDVYTWYLLRGLILAGNPVASESMDVMFMSFTHVTGLLRDLDLLRRAGPENPVLAALCERLDARVGGSVRQWDTLLSLAHEFSGTFNELCDTVLAVTAESSSS